MSGTCRIHEIKIDNFKKIRAVVATLPPGACSIEGRNAQGKTSVLDAIWATLAGKEASPSRPIRDGAAQAKTTLDLGDLVVTRVWTEGGATTLTVRSKVNGKGKFASPQGILDELVGRVGFDPASFSRMKPIEQARTLRQLVGLDTADLDAERDRLYRERTDNNRRVKELGGVFASMPHHADAPPDPIDVRDLIKQHRESAAIQRQNAEVRSNLANALKWERVSSETVNRLRKELEQAEESLAVYRNEVAAYQMDVDDLVEPDMGSILAAIEGTEAANRLVAENAVKEEARKRLETAELAADLGTALIGKIDEEKAQRLASVTFPVPGLSIEGDIVTLNGRPLDLASGSERIRVGLAIASALNPKLRIALVRDGAYLDDVAMDEVQAWAAENDLQVLIERVTSGGESGRPSVVIEDGLVKLPAIRAESEVA